VCKKIKLHTAGTDYMKVLENSSLLKFAVNKIILLQNRCGVLRSNITAQYHTQENWNYSGGPKEEATMPTFILLKYNPVMPSHQNAEQIINIKMADKFLKNVR
jgi:hypothetical protein